MKVLESEVLEALVDLGGQEGFDWLDKQTVDPHQFLGLELNARAAAIAELVIWLGALQWHFRVKSTMPAEPILRDFHNITVMDAVLTWDGWPLPKVVQGDDGVRRETYPNARRPEWPETEYIVGNPPFIGKGEPMREAFGQPYLDALGVAHPEIAGSADFVMFWWNRAAEILTAKTSVVRRFGLVTTNSITQVFNRRVVARHLDDSKKPVSLLLAIPDHPWTKVTADHAAVRIAMTVAVGGRADGVVREVVNEAGLDTDDPLISLNAKIGRINADLSAGVDITAAPDLRSNSGVASNGMLLAGRGFMITEAQAQAMGKDKRPDLAGKIRPYLKGRELQEGWSGRYVIDLDQTTETEARLHFPEIYQHLIETVKQDREATALRTGVKDARDYAANWWKFAKTRRDLRLALAGLQRYIGTNETTKHRVFQFIPTDFLPDHMIVAFAFDDPFNLGVMSSRIHVTWAIRAGGWLGVGNDPRYSKSRCFDPFPFPDCSDDLKDKIRAVAEELDAHRKARQAAHPALTLTHMYNVLEKLRAGVDLDADDERIKTEGLILILHELHDKLDAHVFEAYGWPHSLSDEDILARLVALNKQRAAEETAGHIRWLRPNYQIPKFGSEAERARLADERRAAKAQSAFDLDGPASTDGAKKPKYPTGDELAETIAIVSALSSAPSALSIDDLCSAFNRGGQVKRRITATVQALSRLGHLSSPDGGTSYRLQRAG